MAIITIMGAGMMGSAMSFPACANGNTVRLVGTPLDREIIEHGKKTQEHLTLTHDVNGKKTSFRMPDGVTFHQYEELGECMKGADLLICGVSSFGLDWFCKNVIPVIPEELPVLSEVPFEEEEAGFSSLEEAGLSSLEEDVSSLEEAGLSSLEDASELLVLLDVL